MSTITILAAALAVLNLISFGLMAYDKRCAKTGKRRVPEIGQRPVSEPWAACRECSCAAMRPRMGVILSVFMRFDA